MTSTRGASSFVSMTLAWTIILATVGALAAGVLVPRLAGATPYTVLTGSMRPDYPPGTLVVTRPASADEIAVGDVVTYQLVSGEPEVVTHRVVAVGVSTSGSGERVFRTQGDANGAVDAAPVREVQIQGRLWYSVPLLGHVNHWLTGSTRQLLTTGVVGALVLYATWMFVSSFRDRRTGSDTTTSTTTTRKKGAHAA